MKVRTVMIISELTALGLGLYCMYTGVQSIVNNVEPKDLPAGIILIIAAVVAEMVSHEW